MDNRYIEREHSKKNFRLVRFTDNVLDFSAAFSSPLENRNKPDPGVQVWDSNVEKSEKIFLELEASLEEFSMQRPRL
jgi:hypothetical protein